MRSRGDVRTTREEKRGCGHLDKIEGLGGDFVLALVVELLLNSLLHFLDGVHGVDQSEGEVLSKLDQRAKVLLECLVALSGELWVEVGATLLDCAGIHTVESCGVVGVKGYERTERSDTSILSSSPTNSRLILYQKEPEKAHLPLFFHCTHGPFVLVSSVFQCSSFHSRTKHTHEI